MVINHNMNAMNAHRNMNSSTIAQGKAMEKLSSGLRINRAADDAAGLAIFEKLSAVDVAPLIKKQLIQSLMEIKF